MYAMKKYKTVRYIDNKGVPEAFKSMQNMNNPLF